MLVEGRPFDDICLQCVVNLWYQLPGQRLVLSAPLVNDFDESNSNL